jgi:hypothetical protein
MSGPMNGRSLMYGVILALIALALIQLWHLGWWR